MEKSLNFFKQIGLGFMHGSVLGINMDWRGFWKDTAAADINA